MHARNKGIEIWQSRQDLSGFLVSNDGNNNTVVYHDPVKFTNLVSKHLQVQVLFHPTPMSCNVTLVQLKDGASSCYCTLCSVLCISSLRK